MATGYGMRLGTVQVPGQDRRGEREENKRRTRGKQEQHERATPVQPPCASLATGLHLAFPTLFPCFTVPCSTGYAGITDSASPGLTFHTVLIPLAQRIRNGGCSSQKAGHAFGLPALHLDLQINVLLFLLWRQLHQTKEQPEAGPHLVAQVFPLRLPLFLAGEDLGQRAAHTVRFGGGLRSGQGGRALSRISASSV